RWAAALRDASRSRRAGGAAPPHPAASSVAAPPECCMSDCPAATDPETIIAAGRKRWAADPISFAARSAVPLEAECHSRERASRAARALQERDRGHVWRTEPSRGLLQSSRRQHYLGFTVGGLVHHQNQFRGLLRFCRLEGILLDFLRHSGDGRRLEQRTQRKFNVQILTDSREHLSCDQRMTSQSREEIVVDADLVHPKNIGPNRGKDVLDGRPGRDILHVEMS